MSVRLDWGVGPAHVDLRAAGFHTLGMMRRILAAALVLSWVVLSGIDIIEDLGESFRVAFEASAKIPGPAAVRGGSAHDMTEFSQFARHDAVDTAEISDLYSAGNFRAGFLRSARLYEYHQVFLI